MSEPQIIEISRIVKRDKVIYKAYGRAARGGKYVIKKHVIEGASAGDKVPVSDLAKAFGLTESIPDAS